MNDDSAFYRWYHEEWNKRYHPRFHDFETGLLRVENRIEILDLKNATLEKMIKGISQDFSHFRKLIIGNGEKGLIIKEIEQAFENYEVGIVNEVIEKVKIEMNQDITQAINIAFQKHEEKLALQLKESKVKWDSRGWQVFIMLIQAAIALAMGYLAIKLGIQL